MIFQCNMMIIINIMRMRQLCKFFPDSSVVNWSQGAPRHHSHMGVVRHHSHMGVVQTEEEEKGRKRGKKKRKRKEKGHIKLDNDCSYSLFIYIFIASQLEIFSGFFKYDFFSIQKFHDFRFISFIFNWDLLCHFLGRI